MYEPQQNKQNRTPEQIKARKKFIRKVLFVCMPTVGLGIYLVSHALMYIHSMNMLK